MEFENYKEVFSSKEEFDSLVSNAGKLDSIEENLIVTDFDDTIFSTQESLDIDIRKWRRWEEWNIYIMRKVWLHNFINKLYLNKKFPTIISSKLMEKRDLILTVWLHEMQEAKLKACQLDKYNHIIVPYQIDKIQALMSYVIKTLKYLPTEITIYDDRVDVFVKYKSFLEEILKTKIKIIQVEMNWNEWKVNLTYL